MDDCTTRTKAKIARSWEALPSGIPGHRHQHLFPVLSPICRALLRLLLLPGMLMTVVSGRAIPTAGVISGGAGMQSRYGGIFNGTPEHAQIDGTTYLQKFGYLPGSDLETGALRTDEELHRAVRQFQMFANIPETGRLDATTVEAMKKPRCGVQDKLESHGHHRQRHTAGRSVQEYHLGPSKWQKKWLTFRLLNFTPDLNYHQIRDAFIRAFYVWSDVTQLSFHEVQSGYADIYIQFSSGYHQDGYPFDGPGMVLAHAFFPGDERGGDIHFDEDEMWTVRSEKGVNLFAVASHELGHSLGLAHSNVPGSLMFPWHQGYQPDFKLHPDDIMAIQQVYGAKNPPPPSTVTPSYELPRTPQFHFPATTTTTSRPTTSTTAKKKKVPTATLR